MQAIIKFDKCAPLREDKLSIMIKLLIKLRKRRTIH